MEDCKHNEGTSPDWEYSTCRKCGSILTDSRWGVASNMWFRSTAEAKFYQQHGRHSEGEELKILRAENERLKGEVERATKVMERLTDSITCLCSEGPEFMRSSQIYEACIKDAQDARRELSLG